MRASLPTHDSIQEFEGARHDRMWDGMTLWLEGHISDPITALELRAAQAKAVAYGVTARTEACLPFESIFEQQLIDEVTR